MELQLAEVHPFVFFVGFILLFAVIAVFGIIQSKKRREAWGNLAQKLGCSYDRNGPFNIEYTYPHSLFRKGHGRRANNVLSGRVDGCSIEAFDYRYKTTSGTGKNRREQTHYFTCMVVEAPIPFQDLWIRPESFLDRVGEFVGIDDIDFESEEFSRAFFVKCSDKRFAYDILHARAMELLLETKKIHIEAQGQQLLFYYSGLKRVPEDVEPMIRNGARFLKLIPNYLLEQHGVGPQA